MLFHISKYQLGIFFSNVEVPNVPAESNNAAMALVEPTPFLSPLKGNGQREMGKKKKLEIWSFIFRCISWNISWAFDFQEAPNSFSENKLLQGKVHWAFVVHWKSLLKYGPKLVCIFLALQLNWQFFSCSSKQTYLFTGWFEIDFLWNSNQALAMNYIKPLIQSLYN